MKKIILTSALLLSLILAFSLQEFSQAQSQEANKTITLQDGTKIKGKITGFQNGTYTVQTVLFGQIILKDSDVVSISSMDILPPTAQLQPRQVQGNLSDPSVFKAQAAGLQQKLLQDPQAMSQMQALMQDPKFMELLNDKEFVNDIMNYDVQKLQTNPKLQTIINNPQMQQLMEKTKSLEQTQSSNDEERPIQFRPPAQQ